MNELDKAEVLKIKITKIVGNIATVNIRLRGNKNWIYMDSLQVEKGKRVIILDGQEETSRYVTRQEARQLADE